MDGVSGGGGSGGQRSGWLLLLGGAALAATAAAAACAATLYMQQLSENGPRQGSTRYAPAGLCALYITVPRLLQLHHCASSYAFDGIQCRQSSAGSGLKMPCQQALLA